MENEILVYIQLAAEPVLVGRLWARYSRGRESASFVYDKSWLKNNNCFALEPALKLIDATQHTPEHRNVFGAMSDSAPDRWGRILMRRAERNRALIANETPKFLLEIDYLLRVNDETRQGALRFAKTEGGPFLDNSDHHRIPPLLDLPKLLYACNKVLNDKDSNEDLLLILAPGSSLGGARPKASVKDQNDILYIAKFPQSNDEYDVVLWEAVALELARLSKIDVAKHKLVKILDKHAILLQRFDRDKEQRIPFLSAMSMLDATDNQTRSYIEIADAIKQYGANVNYDCAQLWRRIVFNILIANTDDHLRNHGFLYETGTGWVLSPAYDLNPTPTDIKPRILSTAIDLNETKASLGCAYSVADYFGLNQEAAKNIVNEVMHSVAQWRTVAKNIGISNQEINRMASAFEYKV